MISSKKYVDETLRNNNLVANKSLGQNFLVEENIAREIVESADIDEKTCVVEIGPGLGALTEFAVMKAGLVLAYEIDKNMVNILSKTFVDNSNIEITNQDFLKVDIDELMDKIKNKGFEDVVILSNLPYYITSKILNKILNNNYNIKSIVTMMQKEVGQKILRPDKKEYNTLSVILDYQYEVSVVKYVGKNSYLPRPEIDSIVLKFKKISPRYDADFKKLVEVSNALFAARRKTISNNLKPLLSKEVNLEDFFTNIEIPGSTHIEQLSISDIVKITNNIH